MLLLKCHLPGGCWADLSQLLAIICWLNPAHLILLFNLNSGPHQKYLKCFLLELLFSLASHIPKRCEGWYAAGFIHLQLFICLFSLFSTSGERRFKPRLNINYYFRVDTSNLNKLWMWECGWIIQLCVLWKIFVEVQKPFPLSQTKCLGFELWSRQQ